LVIYVSGKGSIPVFVSGVAKHSKNVLSHNREERIPQTEELPEIRKKI
jgi:hypothetical protein